MHPSTPLFCSLLIECTTMALERGYKLPNRQLPNHFAEATQIPPHARHTSSRQVASLGGLSLFPAACRVVCHLPGAFVVGVPVRAGEWVNSVGCLT